MNNIIEELIELETKAGKIVKDIEEKRKNLSSEIAKLVDDIYEKEERETEKKIRLLREDAAKESWLKIEKTKAESTQKLQQMEENFEKHHAQWEEKIFEKILGGSFR